MKIKDILNEQRIYALLHDVPILRESEVELFEDLISLYKPKRVLEVGAVIGKAYGQRRTAYHYGIR